MPRLSRRTSPWPVVCAVFFACGAPPTSGGAGGHEGRGGQGEGAAARSSAPLVAADLRPAEIEAALASLHGRAGAVDRTALAALRSSGDPAAQRAYRLFAVRGDLPAGAGADEPSARGASEVQEEADAPVAPVPLVVSDAAAAEDGEDAAGAGGAQERVAPPAMPDGGGASASGEPLPADSEGDDPAASATAEGPADASAQAPDKQDKQDKPDKPKKASTPSKPKPVAGLTMITRIALHERGNDVELEIVAAGSLAVGTARGDAEIRVIVEDAGALPAALQARPSAGEVRVADVRRGDETVQIAVELPGTWRVASKRSSSSGARVRFAAR